MDVTAYPGAMRTEEDQRLSYYRHHYNHDPTAGSSILGESGSPASISTSGGRRRFERQTHHAHFEPASSTSVSASSSIYGDTAAPPYTPHHYTQGTNRHQQYQSQPPYQSEQLQTRQAHHQAVEDSTGNKTWAQIWSDIEKGNLGSPVKPSLGKTAIVDEHQTRAHPAHQHRQSETVNDAQTAHCGPSDLLTRGRSLLRSAHALLAASLPGVIPPLRDQHPHAHTRSLNNTSKAGIASVAIPQSDKSVVEVKETLSTSLYKSTPVRLLAIVILFFNTLLVLRVMGDPATPFNADNSLAAKVIASGGDPQQIPLSVATLEERFPCVPATSHNDEMQPAPFSEAMSLGLTNIEADVWLQNGTLLAGHEKKNLSPGKTLQAIYLDPLFKLLERANEKSDRLNDSKSDDWKGVFPLAPKQQLMFMVDVKNEPEATFKETMRLLKPFIKKNYLTVFKDGALIPGPLTIVGTGDTMIELVVRQSPRYIFYDAPLIRLQYPIILKDKNGEDSEPIEWSGDIAPIASSKWLWWNYYPDVKALKVFSDEAHKRGIKARWWGVARWPAYFRRALWNLQLKADCDWLNADDLADVAAFLREKEYAKELKLQSESRSGNSRAESDEARAKAEDGEARLKEEDRNEERKDNE